MKKRRYLLIILSVAAALVCISVPANAAEYDDSSPEKILDSQAHISGADQLYSALPQQTRKMLADMGINSLNYDSITKMDAFSIISQISTLLGEEGKAPLSAGAACLGILLLCALTEGTGVMLGDKPLGGTASAVGALCVCTAVIVPICGIIARGIEIINGASGFMLLYVPVMAGLMASSGHQATAASYYTYLMTCSQVITQLSSKLIAPLMNVFLALSVTSSLSGKLNLSSLCTSIFKCAKWVLTLAMSIFVTVLSAQTLVTSSLDNVSRRALRFAVSSFVPVVGGVLSETVSTFSGSLELLRSGAGVFVIIASACIFLPVLVECILWQMSLFLLSGASEILGLGRMKSVFTAVSTVVSMLTAVLACILTVFIISTVIILMSGK